ncbi:uncharacterized protein LY79DRAFT_105136 [Colletotrichum navitas]|uniref:Uncharacterized protein n=1 Tax=Colletotrichum navitas TaxID=681940 RepID=A0AAD8PJX8_9PEZI|nr:uncharacterized protein LY79DRAFT_105136 [Colletotrichum navitas]KAK1566176.1 hypothetical protein LY79DRAFT_105136 [Colletotrichum navitas]
MEYWGVNENQVVVLNLQLYCCCSLDAVSGCQGMSGVDSTDMFLSAIAYSLCLTFTDHPPPSIWLHVDAQNDVDLLPLDYSNTVGYFTY